MDEATENIIADIEVRLDLVAGAVREMKETAKAVRLSFGCVRW